VAENYNLNVGIYNVKDSPHHNLDEKGHESLEHYNTSADKRGEL
jgi:hypothetical protein